MTALIGPNERLDELNPYGLYILQHPDAFRFGTDAVLLAHFARAKKISVYWIWEQAPAFCPF